MMREDSQPPETEFSGDIVRSLTMFFSEVDDEGEFSPEFSVKEEKIEEIMQELYREITCSSYTNNVNGKPTSPPPYIPSPLPSPTSSSFPLSLSSLPFDIKSESCGAAISDSGSTVMAGVELVGPTGNIVGLSENGDRMVGNGCNDGFGEKMDVCDLLEVGDEWLARILGWVPMLELEE